MSAQRVREDPPIPSDGRCYVCRRERPAAAIEHADPFCTTECARGYHDPLAQRLRLFPKPRVVIELGDGRELIPLTRRELHWIIGLANRVER